MHLPADYTERVYAGVLGKLIGVYLGRPFEGWTHEKIMATLGPIEYYVNERLSPPPPLVVTDDDVSGTFTFLRALADHGYDGGLTSAQIGAAWLNYIIEGRTILWWGGFGVSSEHTAYLRLKEGIAAPVSGAAATNGAIIAEQIGAQIFVDGWAMVAPGDPALAADLAARAARVSHDGEAVYAAQVLAAMEALAFLETDVNRLLDAATALIPRDSTIYRLIDDVRGWHAAEPDWQAARHRLAAVYNYENFGGNCHVVPNHALIILALLYGESDFSRSLSIVNSCGWDTDCNSGNLGCLLGIKGGLAALEKDHDWRGPVADRLFLPTAGGGRAITDAVIEAQHVVNTGRLLAGLSPIAPKEGARFHFEQPGSVQGFQPLEATTRLSNVAGYSRLGSRTLRIDVTGRGAVATPTFIQPDELSMPGYQLLASPTLHPGQEVRAGFSADGAATVQLFVSVYNVGDQLDTIYGPSAAVTAGDHESLHWRIPATGGQPIARIGLACSGEGPVYLDSLTWSGAADVTLTRPPGGHDPAAPPQVWRRAWVNAVDTWEPWCPEPYRLVHNQGRGLISQGTADWTDYAAEATVSSWLMAAGGIAVRVQGLRRFYALQLVDGGMLRLLKAYDGDIVLAQKHFPWTTNTAYTLRLDVQGNRLRAWVDDEPAFNITDHDRPLAGGGVAYVVEQGHLSSNALHVMPSRRGSGRAHPHRPVGLL